MTHPAMITDAAAAKGFVLGGNATFTVKSVATGKRYTYKVTAPWDGAKRETDNPRRFVQLLVAPKEYEYIGFFYEDRLNAGKKGNANHPAFKALAWLMGALTTVAGDPDADHTIPEDKLEIWHNGRCGRCGRQLTDPVSIERGFGPECAAHMEAA